jgi:cytidylate kinase
MRVALSTICISHATGAAGREVGRLVAERLSLAYVDDEVIAEAAEWAELDPQLVADAERRKSLVGRLLGSIGAQPSPRLTPGEVSRALPSDTDLRGLITRTVATYVRQGGCVIVAHAASFVVEPGEALRVLVTASTSTRVERLSQERGIDATEAAQVLRAEDVGRSDYLKRFYGVERELPTHYDLVVNSDAVSAATAAAVIIAGVGH